MYIADLHIHSRFSRATSKDGNPEQLDLWARRKGIDLVGTGDFTHPEWRKELAEKLEPAEDGFYVLKEEYRIRDPLTPDDRRPRFVVTGEISSIYKKGDRVRKVHSVIILPGLLEAELLSKKLETIGNVHSDGRPILGLDCRDLLEIALEQCPETIYIPAHIWTPHFSLFGAFSGFDSVEECFGDMTSYVHAMETGLSSDPPMNWRLSALDSYQLISNSDAHSPAKLGREANLLDIPFHFGGLYEALQTGRGLTGTIEFFPEEGKYHYDGHRKCHLCLSPSESLQYDGRCPVCGRKLTIGVSHRVEQLADREEGFVLPGAKSFESLVPLPEVIAASTGRSPASVKVAAEYSAMVGKLGPEFEILRAVPLEEIKKASGHLVAEGVRRLREGLVERIPGYDGEYGTIRLFTPSEIENPVGQMSLFSAGQLAAMAETAAGKAEPEFEGADAAAMAETAAAENAQTDSRGLDGRPRPDRPNGAMQPQDAVHWLDGLNDRQREAVTKAARAIAVVAGPGTGKTKTLVSRILYLLRERKVKPAEITAVTFTKKAAEEMRERLEKELGGKRAVGRMRIGTFHSICSELLRQTGRKFRLADDLEVMELAKEVLAEHKIKISPKQFLRLVSLRKAGLMEEKEENPAMEPAIGQYGTLLRGRELLDFDDLLAETVRLFEEGGETEAASRNFSFLLVDEFQDISPIQFRLIRAWNKKGKELFVIGDPDQSIYSFRGSDSRCFRQLSESWPRLETISLQENYRSTSQILSAAVSLISQNEGGERTLLARNGEGRRIRLAEARSELSEGIFIAGEIGRMVGGIDMLGVQDGLDSGADQKVRGFSDIAVLYRTHRQSAVLEDCLKREGIPYVVMGRDDFLTEEKVRGTVCFFRYLKDPEDRLAGETAGKLLWGLEPNEISSRVVEDMAEQFREPARKEKPGKLLNRWMAKMDLEENDAVRKLASMAVFHKTMEEFLEVLSFGSEGDLKRCGGKAYTADAVTLMTLHGSKGLEFPAVILCGAGKGLIPLESGREPADEAEERRLFYVGMTRAREELILTTPREESPFLKEIPGSLIAREAAGKKQADAGRQLSLFDFMQ